MTDFAPIFPGWNVWSVFQVRDLDFNPLMLGVSRDRQLRIWVEDAVRLGAPGATVADPVDLKGGQVEILPSKPAGLSVAIRKEQVGGSAMVVDGPADLRFVRFFNRGAKANLVWPHDDNYLLNEVFTPNPTAPATQGPPPPTVGSGVGQGVGSAAGDIAKGAFNAAPYLIIGSLALAFLLRRK